MTVEPNDLERPCINFDVSGKIRHTKEGILKVQLTNDWIRIGCTNIHPDVAKNLVEKWEEHFGKAS